MSQDNTSARAFNFATRDPLQPVPSKDADWERPVTVVKQRITGSVNTAQRSAAVTDSARVVEFDPTKFLLPSNILQSSRFDSHVSSEAPNGRFDSTPVIGGFSPVEGGLYISTHYDELVYVDESIGALQPVYTELTLRYVERFEEQKPLEQHLAPLVVALVKEKLAATREEINFYLEHIGVNALERVDLDSFVDAKLGAARHHILLAAYLFERLVKRGLLSGRVYVDNGLRPDASKQAESVTFYGSSGYRYSYKPEIEVPHRNFDTIHPFID